MNSAALNLQLTLGHALVGRSKTLLGRVIRVKYFSVRIPSVTITIHRVLNLAQA